MTGTMYNGDVLQDFLQYPQQKLTPLSKNMEFNQFFCDSRSEKRWEGAYVIMYR